MVGLVTEDGVPAPIVRSASEFSSFIKWANMQCLNCYRVIFSTKYLFLNDLHFAFNNELGKLT